MTPEIDYLAKYAPSIAVLIVMVILVVSLIIYIKKSLFTGMVSQEMFNAQLQRESEFITATKEAGAHLEEISRQLESITHKQSEGVKQQTDTIRDLLQDVAERLRTLELVFSDNIDAIRLLASQCEKHRKNIPDTEVFLAKRKEKQP